MIRVAVSGFGRIGRLLIRALIEQQGQHLDLVAINTTGNKQTSSYLLSYDSVHGTFLGVSEHPDHDSLIIREKEVPLTHERDPRKISWKDHGIDIVFDCTGAFNKDDSIRHYLHDQQVKHVVVSAPCSKADITSVIGVNHQNIDTQKHKIISVASCTTNCLGVVMHAIDQHFSLEKAHALTVHAVTNDQNIVDGMHRDLRRARASHLSMIPTSTGAAKNMELILPHLKGKIISSSVRVPINNVSMIDVTCVVKKELSQESLNSAFIHEADRDSFGVIQVTNQPLVSCDFNHSTASATIDLLETKILDSTTARILAWYDNEWGFVCRMVDTARLLT